MALGLTVAALVVGAVVLTGIVGFLIDKSANLEKAHSEERSSAVEDKVTKHT